MQSKLFSQRVVGYHLSYSKHNLSLKVFEEKGNGFILFTYESDTRLVYIQSADNSKENISHFCKEINLNEKEAIHNIYNTLNGAFQVFIWNKKEKKLKSICDYLGVCATLYTVIEKDKIVFFPNYLNFKELKKPLKISKEGALAHFGFGYHVEPFPYIFEGVSVLKGRLLLVLKDGSTEQYKLELEYSIDNKKSLPANFKNAIQSTLYDEKYFIGATAGKDSLAILSSINEETTCKTGNFGNVNSADVIQGEKIANELGFPFETLALCDEQEFEKYSNIIANVSGGLATCSYVDMLKFVENLIPTNYAYLMGEGGESVRSFFDTSNNDIVKALENYITPVNFLTRCFSDEMCSTIENYPHTLTDKVKETYSKDTLSQTLMHFYRFGRMPGNFSNRHRILNRYRDKCIPFLNSKVIINSFGLEDFNYENDGIHRDIIKQNREAFIKYFDQPVNSSESVQAWGKRFKGSIGLLILSLLEKNLDSLSEIFNKKQVLAFVEEEIKNPGRGVYFIFRILSLSLFLTHQSMTETREKV